MRSQRRLRLYVVVVVVFLVAFTYFTVHHTPNHPGHHILIFLCLKQTDTGGGIQSHRFYKNTVTAMDNAHTATTKKNNEAKEAKDRSHIQRLDLENNNNNNNGGTRKTTSAPSSYNEKQEKPVGSSHGKIDESEEISVAGRTKMSIPKPKEDQMQLSEKKSEAVDKPVESKSNVATEHEHEISKVEEEEREASAEFNSILKRSPSTFVQTFPTVSTKTRKKASNYLSQSSYSPNPTARTAKKQNQS